MKEQRPNPDKLLQRAKDEDRKKQRGKLKIYLGAAPGVGKTYSMLSDALNERAKGLDVVVGVVESHGREEVEEFLKNFETLPRQHVEYHDKELLEFDLDATLKRCPSLILVDEMAHTNVPGLRHKKRWQDIKELLERGIDVYTTLNVQHIESLNDDVAQIIRAPIKETVPDSMVESADTIELVDIPPEALLERLQEGKVYIPEQATLAAEHFFRKGNLTALRELALRITAEWVGTEVLLYRQKEGIKYIWPTKDKILVCVGPKPSAKTLIRAAKRIANSLQAEWMAVYIDTPKLQASDKMRAGAIENLRLAEQLGAETRVLAGIDIVKEILDFSREKNVTQIMILKQIRNRWQDWIYRNLADEIVRNSGEIDVYIMTNKPNDEIKAHTSSALKKATPWKTYGAAVGLVGLATLINVNLYPLLAASNLIMIYVLAVTIVALLGKRGPAILSSILSVLAYDFFFTPPAYSFFVSDIKYAVTLGVMLMVTQVISYLTFITHRRAASARSTQHRTFTLYTLSRQLAQTRNTEKLLEIGTKNIADNFDSYVLALLPKNHHLEIQGNDVLQQTLDAKEYAIAQWVFEIGQIAGFGTDTLSFSDALYIPLVASKKPIGVLRISPKKQVYFSPEQLRLLELCVHQIALALEVAA
jgi:two-component system sensor histidine kinase KdpD